uniref:Uncharacterized protein n=1 Tax=Solanum lycopersicum TaxID=4081 RepID=A0A3Q7EBG7_SOLLC
MAACETYKDILIEFYNIGNRGRYYKVVCFYLLDFIVVFLDNYHVLSVCDAIVLASTTCDITTRFC